jgi:drug/metabolite transporter (DMT)-like permease
MALRELFSAAMFAFALAAVPDGLATVGRVMTNSDLAVPIVVAGAIGGYSYAIWYRSISKIGVARAMALNISYAMWGALLAWTIRAVPMTLLAILGCAVVTVGAVLTIMSDELRATSGTPSPPGPA